MADQVITTSMDDRAAPIGRLLKWVKMTTDESVADISNIGLDKAAVGDVSKNRKIAVCFCGPPALGAMHALSESSGFWACVACACSFCSGSGLPSALTVRSL